MISHRLRKVKVSKDEVSMELRPPSPGTHDTSHCSKFLNTLLRRLRVKVYIQDRSYSHARAIGNFESQMPVGNNIHRREPEVAGNLQPYTNRNSLTDVGFLTESTSGIKPTLYRGAGIGKKSDKPQIPHDFLKSWGRGFCNVRFLETPEVNERSSGLQGREFNRSFPKRSTPQTSQVPRLKPAEQSTREVLGVHKSIHDDLLSPLPFGFPLPFPSLSPFPAGGGSSSSISSTRACSLACRILPSSRYRASPGCAPKKDRCVI